MNTDIMTTDTTMVSSATTRAAFRRAGKRLAEAGIQVALSDPTCCKSCATFPTLDDNASYLVGYRLDGRMNDRRMFNTAWSPEWPEYLGWDNKTMPEGEFLVAVYRALTAEGFTVRLPESDKQCIVVRYTKEVAS